MKDNLKGKWNLFKGNMKQKWNKMNEKEGHHILRDEGIINKLEKQYCYVKKTRKPEPRYWEENDEDQNF